MNTLLQFADYTLVEILSIVWPIIVVQIILQIYCIVKVLKEGTRNLSKPIWIFIIIVFNIFGPVSYLILGTSKE